MATEQHAGLKPGPIPSRAGVGLKPQHFETILETRPKCGWFEIHPENYMGAGGAPHHFLTRIRNDYPLSLHGVGLSLGSADGVSTAHLEALKTLIDRYQPGLVSEHLSWSRWQNISLNDLLPLPYTDETLSVLCRNIDITQNILQRTLLIENPASYLQVKYSHIEEAEFLVTLAQSSGAGILLDVNNVFVSACNHGFDARAYISRIPTELIGEIHLAGHATENTDGQEIRIDDHGSEVCDDVWKLYEYTLAQHGPVPTLIEWDTNVPDWSILFGRAQKAEAALARPTSGSVEQTYAGAGI